VNKRGLYAIRISGLGDGDHDFSFELDQQFFALFEYPEIENGMVQARVLFEKRVGVLALHFDLSGEVEVTCDRCLEPFRTSIETKQTIFVKLGEEVGEVDDDVIIIARDEHEIEVGQYMCEFIILALPYQRMHPEDKDGISSCDPAMLKRLEAHQVNDLDQKSSLDPRWDALKGIIEKNK
jgi:uncharacterized protein